MSRLEHGQWNVVNSDRELKRHLLGNDPAIKVRITKDIHTRNGVIKRGSKTNNYELVDNYNIVLRFAYGGVKYKVMTCLDNISWDAFEVSKKLINDEPSVFEKLKAASEYLRNKGKS